MPIGVIYACAVMLFVGAAPLPYGYYTLLPRENGVPGAAAGRPLFYKALVSVDAGNVNRDGEPLPLAAGMQVAAEILLGRRTVAEYLLSPVRQAWHEAGRER